MGNKLNDLNKYSKEEKEKIIQNINNLEKELEIKTEQNTKLFEQIESMTSEINMKNQQIIFFQNNIENIKIKQDEMKNYLNQVIEKNSKLTNENQDLVKKIEQLKVDYQNNMQEIQQRMKNQKSEGEEEEEEESEDIRYRKKIKDDATERKDINNTKNDNIKDEYENKSTTSKIKSEFSFEKDKVEVMKPIKLKDKKVKGQNKSFTNKNLINFISPDISEVGTGNQDVATIENKDKKLNKTNLVIEDSNLNNGNKKKKSLKISDNHQNNFVKNNLETLEALTPKRNIKSNINFEDDDMEGEFVISNKITFKSNGSDKNLKQSINDK